MWTNRSLRPGRAKRFSHLRKVLSGSVAHYRLVQWIPEAFLRDQSGRSVRLITLLQIVPRLRMSGAMSPLIMYKLATCTGSTLPLSYPIPSGSLL